MNHPVHFEPDWQSLKAYQTPEWFRNAKFGIFMHWGVQSIAANNGWYGRFMYMQEGALWGNAYAHHLAHHGHPSEFGYKDLIPLWHAENWNPDELAAFYRRIGARYIVPVAVHHDNFDNYNSTWQPWNSVNMGPCKDILREWKNAAARHGLRFGVSSHSDRTWDWFNTAHGSDTTGPMKGIPYDGNLTLADGKGKWWEGYDPNALYTRPHGNEEEPDQAYCENWYKRTSELIDQYQPDLLYFDGPMPIVRDMEGGGRWHEGRTPYGMRIASHFYNASMAWHNGSLEAVLNLKQWEPDSLPEKSAFVLDVEKGQIDEIYPLPWQTDTSLTETWFYAPDPLELGETVVIHNLCDIVSKNGNLLLNVGLMADGTLPDDQRGVLEEVGRWLQLNGEAIYDTRPWITYGEGPTKVEQGHFKQNTQPFTAEDIRYTTSGNTLYAILLGWPAHRRVTLTALRSGHQPWFGEINRIGLIGCDEPLVWSVTPEGLEVTLPDAPPCRHAVVLKIT